jgi:hypothetical protein
MSNEKKTATLGMPHGTASNRLRKMLLFRQLKKHRENVCVRCNKEIETVEELSVEHIKPWEGVSSELFWDLNNIAFSHSRCNLPHKYSNGPAVTINNVPGMNWCYRHRKHFPVDQFTFDRSTRTGLRQLCKECQHCYRKPSLTQSL